MTCQSSQRHHGGVGDQETNSTTEVYLLVPQYIKSEEWAGVKTRPSVPCGSSPAELGVESLKFKNAEDIP